MQTSRVIEYIVDWMKRYAAGAGIKGFVVGISGGVDSAVTSALCAKTNFSVKAATMPIRQAKSQKTLAEKHVSWLEQRFDNVTGHRTDLTQVLEAFEKTLPADIQDDLTMANTRARIRMIALYAYAGHYNMLVAGTGNKVEDFGVGFFTKYGDGGVDIAPIADLMKSEVYEVARGLGIMDEIIETPPTDGLWPDSRTDEEQFGASYADLEWAMRFEEQGGDEGSLTRRQKKVLEIYRRLNRENRHKMEPIPMPVIPGEFK